MTDSFWPALATWAQVTGSLLSVVLALVGLVIARAAARESRENRDYQLDRSAADDFAATVDALYAGHQAGRVDIAGMSMGFRQAVTTWAERATSTRRQATRGEVPGFLIELERQSSRSFRGAVAPDLMADLRYTGTLARAKRLTRAWSYPEQRRDVLREVLLERAGTVEEQRHSPEVQMRRWMLVSDPSPRYLVQLRRQVGVWIFILCDDLRAGKLHLTIKDGVIYTLRARQERRAFRLAQRRARIGGPPQPEE